MIFPEFIFSWMKYWTISAIKTIIAKIFNIIALFAGDRMKATKFNPSHTIRPIVLIKEMFFVLVFVSICYQVLVGGKIVFWEVLLSQF
jgi:hypothetical protein